MKQSFEILPAQLVQHLEQGEYQRIEINFETHVIYEGHIPNVGYLLLEGDAYLCKRNRPLQRLQKNSLVGVEELLGHTPFKWGLKVGPGTKLLILDRSTLMEILNDHEHFAHTHFKDLIAV